ncbi:MAG TPA: TonB-dependent receptor, partial [Bacteroidales bacterium]|nr:TonB-dependent receptor [Bacteroidales bacterium]
ILLLTSLLIFSQSIFSQKTKTDANVFGHVTSGGEHIPFVTVLVKGTTIGTITDETGHFRIIDLPTGEIILKASMMGYKPKEYKFNAKENTTTEIKFDLEPDVLNLEEVIVTANRSEQKRVEAPVIVNTISPTVFTTTQSVSLGEALNFSPGLRLENNCQNCGFSQVRMNGLEGPYSQILINSRPVFSGLAGVYGLELIPSSMIDKIEVVRGGGSALYGSNAIAGTINIRLKDPVRDSYEAGMSSGITGVGIDGSGGSASDIQANFNTSVVSDDLKSGVSLYGFTRDRGMFDANDDSFSELTPIKNLTLGTRLFHRFMYRDKLSVDFFTIREERDGGNKQEYPVHERDIAEVLNHDLKAASITYDKFFRDQDLLSIYASGQLVNRDSYYGAEQSMTDYGNTLDRTYNIGAQYKSILGSSTLIAGVENTGGFLVDKKLGYPDYDNATIEDGEITKIPHTENITIADQVSIITGVFVQYDIDLDRLKIAVGGRYDYYSIEDRAHEGEKETTGNVFSPRINLMYGISESLKARLSYSQGYRAPQIFDEDLHIESSGSRQVLHRNDPDLKQETSHTILASLDFNGNVGSTYTGLLVEGFYTRLLDSFANEFGDPDEDGIVIYTRINSEGGATVQGVNIEFKFRPLQSFNLYSGFTVQSSRFDEVQEFNEKRFFRSPDAYGFINFYWEFAKNSCMAVSGNYTGKMLVPYFGTETDPDIGELRESDSFFDMGIKLRQDFRLNGATMRLFGGIKNIFNSYQSDFDIGVDRDPGYIYGPLSPRTIYIGVKFGNLSF